MLNQMMFSIPRTPVTTEEVLNLLDPRAREFDSPLTVFAKLDPSHKRALVDLASQYREAESNEDKQSATDSIRAALFALGFGEKWVNEVFPNGRKVATTMKAELPEGEKTRGAGWPMNRDFHESNCRYFSTTTGEPDGNQGGFAE